MFWILDAMEEFVDNFYSYDFAGNLVSEKDESESEMDFDIVNLEQKDSRDEFDDDDDYDDSNDESEMDLPTMASDLSEEIQITIDSDSE